MTDTKSAAIRAIWDWAVQKGTITQEQYDYVWSPAQPASEESVPEKVEWTKEDAVKATVDVVARLKEIEEMIQVLGNQRSEGLKILRESTQALRKAFGGNRRIFVAPDILIFIPNRDGANGEVATVERVPTFEALAEAETKPEESRAVALRVKA